MGEGKGEPLDQRDECGQGGRARCGGKATTGLVLGSVRNYKVTVVRLGGAVGPISRVTEVKCGLVEVQNNWKSLKCLHGLKLNKACLPILCSFL